MTKDLQDTRNKQHGHYLPWLLLRLHMYCCLPAVENAAAGSSQLQHGLHHPQKSVISTVIKPLYAEPNNHTAINFQWA